jgi:hypothetical protein
LGPAADAIGESEHNSTIVSVLKTLILTKKKVWCFDYAGTSTAHVELEDGCSVCSCVVFALKVLKTV